MTKDLLKRLQEETATPFQPVTPEERAERRKNVKDTFAGLASEVGLTGRQAEMFVRYMQTRWPEKEGTDMGYVATWAERFKNGTEWDRADGEGRLILRELDPEIYPPKDMYR